MIVPDKRFCFDYFQPASDVAKILGDHFFRPSSRHSFETHYRTTMHVVAELKSGITLAWGQENVTSFEFLKPGPLVGDPKKIYDYAFEVVRSADYKDNHNNFFTPATFLIIIEELRYLGLINFQVDTVTRPRGCEFLVIMRRARLGPPPLTKFLEKKKMLLMQAMREEKERLDFGPIL